MKRFLILLAFILLTPVWAQPTSVTVEVGEWKPYVDSVAGNQGFSTEIVVTALERAGIDVTVEFLPWNRVSSNIDSGDALSYPWFLTDERNVKWDYSQPIFSARQAIMIRADSGITVSSLEDLRPYWVATTTAYSYGNLFDSFADQLQIDEAPSDINNINKLLRGRVDAFLIDPFVGGAMLQDEFTAAERAQLDLIYDTPFEDGPLHLVCGKTMDNCDYFLQKFNEGLALMQADGSYDAIINRALGAE